MVSVIYVILMILFGGVFILAPAAALAFFIVSLVLFIKSKIQQKRLHDSYNEKKAKNRLVMLIVSSCLLAVSLLAIFAILLGFYNAIAYM